MILLLLSIACKSVGGTEGFAVQDLVLAHRSGSELVETQLGFERFSTGQWILLAWGGGTCGEYVEPPAPEGEGWDETDEDASDDASHDFCDTLKSIGADAAFGGYAAPSRRSSRALTVNLSDYYEETGARAGDVTVYECRSPDLSVEWEVQLGVGEELVLQEQLDDFSIKVIDEKHAHVKASLDSRVYVDWTVKYCEL